MKIEVDGAAQLAKVRRELRRIGDKSNMRRLYRGLNRATKPMRAEAKTEALRRLPRRGGLAARVARAPLRTSTRAGGVSITGSSKSQLRNIDEGRVRHPVYGNRSVWIEQPVRKHFFTDPMEAGAPKARRELVTELDRLGREIAAKTTS